MDGEKAKHTTISSKGLEVNGMAAFGFTFDENPFHQQANDQEEVPPYMQNEYSQMLAQGIISLPT